MVKVEDLVLKESLDLSKVAAEAVAIIGGHDKKEEEELERNNKEEDKENESDEDDDDNNTTKIKGLIFEVAGGGFREDGIHKD
jgi:ribosomal protein L12E/L44/L45/RPP1/RPP2